jgi:hypothetical protein
MGFIKLVKIFYFLHLNVEQLSSWNGFSFFYPKKIYNEHAHFNQCEKLEKVLQNFAQMNVSETYFQVIFMLDLFQNVTEGTVLVFLSITGKSINNQFKN